MNIGFLRELLREDVGYGDITTSLLPDKEVNGCVIAKEDMIVSGAIAIEQLFLEHSVKCERLINDGGDAKKGSIIMRLKGNVREVLTLERTALNILQRMSGIATITRQCVDVAGPNVKIAATRKTILPYLDKMAVIDGGGDPHRWRLDDMFLIKDNHIKVLGIGDAVRKARMSFFSKKIEVEVEGIEQAVEAARAGADIIMLDNMGPKMTRDSVKSMREDGYTGLFEASGNIDPDNLREYAKSGVDIISMGWLTHSVRSMDISLDIDGD